MSGACNCVYNVSRNYFNMWRNCGVERTCGARCVSVTVFLSYCTLIVPFGMGVAYCFSKRCYHLRLIEEGENEFLQLREEGGLDEGLGREQVYKICAAAEQHFNGGNQERSGRLLADIKFYADQTALLVDSKENLDNLSRILIAQIRTGHREAATYTLATYESLLAKSDDIVDVMARSFSLVELYISIRSIEAFRILHTLNARLLTYQDQISKRGLHSSKGELSREDLQIIEWKQQIAALQERLPSEK